ncbi:hypothetical protein [Clostridium novyi]|nr:hypothetical protein [Clostridium novyi]
MRNFKVSDFDYKEKVEILKNLHAVIKNIFEAETKDHFKIKKYEKA